MSAWHDVLKALQAWRLWLALAIQDINLRYKRSVLGPFWLTLSMAVTIVSIGFLYGHLFGRELAHYFPYLATSLICWGFISSIIRESADVYLQASTYVSNFVLPYTVFPMQMVMRNILVFLHNFVVIIPLMFIFHLKLTLYTLLFIPGMALILVNALTWGTLIAMASTRYRDFSQIIVNLLQVVFFVTPIIWMPDRFPAQYRYVFEYNPFNQFLNLLRNPLLGTPIEPITMDVTLGVTFAGLFLFTLIFSKLRRRIVFWV